MSCVYWAPKSRIKIFWCKTPLFDPVIRGLLDDLDVMHVGLAHAGRGDLDELGARAQLLDRRAAGVSHARAHAAGELLDHPQRAALVGHTPFDSLRHEFVDVHLRV